VLEISIFSYFVIQVSVPTSLPLRQ